MKMRMRVLLKGLLLLVPLCPAISGAQQYPTKSVAMTVPFPPGGSNDLIARYVSDNLGKLWKQTVVVENRPGAGSSLGSAYIARSAPDGYRVLFISSSYTTNAATRSDQGFDPVKDLKPVSMVARGQNGVVTGLRVPMNSLADLARETKSKPIYYGTAGVGSGQHFYGELLNDAMGIQMTPVPYKGGQEAFQDLLAGRIDVVVGALGGQFGAIATGKAKLIAVLGKTRSPAAPNTPTALESGYPDAVSDNYWAVFVPSATPDAIGGRLNAGIKTVTTTPEGRQFLVKMDGEPTELSPEEVSVYVKKEIEYWTRLARKLNLTDAK